MKILHAMAAAMVTALLAAAPVAAAAPPDVVRLGNLKFAHYGAVAYVKEIAPACGIRVEEKVFAKGLDVMQAIIAGEIDVGATAAEAAIAGRAGGAPVLVVAGFARGGARLVTQAGLPLRGIAGLKGKKVGVTRGGIHEVLLLAELQQAGLSADSHPGKDVQLVYLPFADLNQALMARHIDAMMQSEPQSSQAISRGFGVEVSKPYRTPIGEPVRTLVMTEQFYTARRPLAARFMRCFVQATASFMTDRALAERYVRHTMFRGQISAAEYAAAIGNSPYSLDITAEHIQLTTDLMVKTGVGRMARPPLARDWVRTDLLADAKRQLGVK